MEALRSDGDQEKGYESGGSLSLRVGSLGVLGRGYGCVDELRWKAEMGAAVALWRLGLDAEARSNTLFLVARKPSLIAQLGRAVVKKENGQNNEEERCDGTGEGRRRREWAAGLRSASGARWRTRRAALAFAASAAWASKAESALACTGGIGDGGSGSGGLGVPRRGRRGGCSWEGRLEAGRGRAWRGSGERLVATMTLLWQIRRSVDVRCVGALGGGCLCRRGGGRRRQWCCRVSRGMGRRRLRACAAG